MKKQLAAVILSGLVLTGCSSKALSASSTENKLYGKVNLSAKSTQIMASKSASQQKVKVKTDFKPIKPKTVPALSSTEKSQINTKLNSALKQIDSTLKSLQDAKEINLTNVK